MLSGLLSSGHICGLFPHRQQIRGQKTLVTILICSDSAVTRAACKGDPPKEEEMYNLWLEALGSREAQDISPQHVKDCLRMINSILSGFA